jgi:hypothetical protein
MQSVSCETSVNLKPSVATAFTNTKMVSIGSKLSPAWLNSKALTVSMTVQIWKESCQPWEMVRYLQKIGRYWIPVLSTEKRSRNQIRWKQNMRHSTTQRERISMQLPYSEFWNGCSQDSNCNQSNHGMGQNQNPSDIWSTQSNLLRMLRSGCQTQWKSYVCSPVVSFLWMQLDGHTKWIRTPWNCKWNSM